MSHWLQHHLSMAFHHPSQIWTSQINSLLSHNWTDIWWKSLFKENKNNNSSPHENKPMAISSAIERYYGSLTIRRQLGCTCEAVTQWHCYDNVPKAAEEVVEGSWSCEAWEGEDHYCLKHPQMSASHQACSSGLAMGLWPQHRALEGLFIERLIV